MIKNEILLNAYNNLLENHTESESNYILLNSLAVLGDKKIQISETLDKDSLARVNKYKYPDRLASFIATTSKKSQQWGELSFAKLAFS